VSGNVETDRLLDANEIAEWLNVTPAWVHGMASTGEMPAIKLALLALLARVGSGVVDRARDAHAHKKARMTALFNGSIHEPQRTPGLPSVHDNDRLISPPSAAYKPWVQVTD